MPWLAATKRPELALLRVGECAARVSEQLALDQTLGNRRAVHGHERTAVPRAQEVKRARQQILARSALAGDQHAHVAVGHLRELAQQRGHLRTRGDDIFQAVIARQLDPQPLHFVAQVAIFQRARDDQQQFAVAEGLGDVIEGAELHRFDRGLNRSERRDDDHRQVGRDPLQLGLQSVPAHPGHPQIRNQHVGGFPLDHRDRFMPRMRAQRAVSCLAQNVATAR